MKQITEEKMLHRAAAYCSTAERCLQDVQKKIRAADLTSEEEERIIARLTKEGFIDEARYARYFVNDKLRFNKWGRIKIGYELQKKNIQTSTRVEALKEIDGTEYTNILRSLLKAKKKSVGGKNEREVYAKLLRFASGRGFESREVFRCLNELFQTDDYEESFE